LPTNPGAFPASLTRVDFGDNPELFGNVTSALVLQCKGGIGYRGCKQAYQCSEAERRAKAYMQGPFVVGVSVSSTSIPSHVFFCMAKSLSLAMLLDAPRPGDPQRKMTATHGPSWVAWQEVWLQGLLNLPRGSKIFVVIAEDFEVKFIDMDRKFTDDASCRRCCFDPTYELPAGERAKSILDWERRQFILAAKQNSLTIVHSYHGEDKGAFPAFYYVGSEYEYFKDPLKELISRILN